MPRYNGKNRIKKWCVERACLGCERTGEAAGQTGQSGAAPRTLCGREERSGATSRPSDTSIMSDSDNGPSEQSIPTLVIPSKKREKRKTQRGNASMQMGQCQHTFGGCPTCGRVVRHKRKRSTHIPRAPGS